MGGARQTRRSAVWSVLFAGTLLSLLAPTGAASTSQELGPLVVEVEDQFGDECAPRVHGVCVANYSRNGSFGDSTLDLYHRVAYVGVAVDVTYLGIPLPGDEETWRREATVNGSSLSAPNPLVPLLTERWESVPQPAPTMAHLNLTEEGIDFGYYGPTGDDPLAGPQEGHLGFNYGKGKGIQYDRVGPFNTPKGSDSDAIVTDSWAIACDLTMDPGCHNATAPIVDRGLGWTPNVAFGVEFYDLEVASDPDLLGQATNEEAPSAQAGAAKAPDSVEAALAPPSGPMERSNREGPRAGITPKPRQVPQDPWFLLDRPDTETSPVPLLHTLERQGQEPQSFDPILFIASLSLSWALGSLYSRFTSKKDILGSEKRRLILDVAARTPGVAWMDAARAVGLTRTALDHHVRHLERAGLLRVAEVGGRKFLYRTAGKTAPGELSPETPAAARCIRTEILHLLEQKPEGLTREQLHQRFPSVPERTRRYNLERLLTLGLLEEVAEGAGPTRVRRVTAGSASVPSGSTGAWATPAGPTARAG